MLIVRVNFINYRRTHETSHCQLARVPDSRRSGRCHHHGGMTPSDLVLRANRYDYWLPQPVAVRLEPPMPLPFAAGNASERSRQRQRMSGHGN